MTFRKFESESVVGASGELRLGKMVGTGAEGAVYRVVNASDVVAKIFKEKQRARKEAKVRAMVKDANTPRDPTYEDRGIHSIVWPTEVVEHTQTDEFLGYTMPHKDLNWQKNAQRYAREELKWSDSDPKERYATALNLALVVHAIHRQGHAMGDMNHENILINDGFVSLIDCDSFVIAGADETYTGDTYFPRYTPPEGRRNDLKSVCRSDLFGLGVHIFQLLMAGFHPYQATGSEATVGQFGEMIAENDFPYATPRPGELEPHAQAPDYDRLPADIRQLFEKCFNLGKRNSPARPNTRKWLYTLGKASGVEVEIRRDTAEDTETADSPAVDTDTNDDISRDDSDDRPREETTKMAGTPSEPPSDRLLRRVEGTAKTAVAGLKRLLIYIAIIVLVSMVMYLFLL